MVFVRKNKSEKNKKSEHVFWQKNWFNIVEYLKQVNIFTEIVICVAVDCKVYVFINLQGTKIWNSVGS